MLDFSGLTHDSMYLDMGFETLNLKLCELNSDNCDSSGTCQSTVGILLKQGASPCCRRPSFRGAKRPRVQGPARHSALEVLGGEILEDPVFSRCHSARRRVAGAPWFYNPFAALWPLKVERLGVPRMAKAAAAAAEEEGEAADGEKAKKKRKKAESQGSRGRASDEALNVFNERAFETLQLNT